MLVFMPQPSTDTHLGMVNNYQQRTLEAKAKLAAIVKEKLSK